MLAYKSSPRLTSHKDALNAPLDDAQSWEESPQDRPELAGVIIRLPLGTMPEMGGADRRAAVLGTLEGCATEKLGLLVDLVLRPMGLSGWVRRDGAFAVHAVPAPASEKQQAELVG